MNPKQFEIELNKTAQEINQFINRDMPLTIGKKAVDLCSFGKLHIAIKSMNKKLTRQ